MNSCQKFVVISIESSDRITSYLSIKEGRDPIFQVQRKLRHVSLYIILVLCPAVNTVVKIQRLIRDKSNPKEVSLPCVSNQNDRNGVRGLNGKACDSEK